MFSFGPDSACAQEFVSSADVTSGTFGSPLYPDPYPAYVTCRFFFRGVVGERVKISFQDFDLSYNFGDPNETERSASESVQPGLKYADVITDNIIRRCS